MSADTHSDTFKALVDSGTEITMMSAEIADTLGISPFVREWHTVSSLGGTKKGFLAQVIIVVPEFPSEILTTNVLFVSDISYDLSFDILLGQDDFFRRFLIKFEKHKNKFYLDIA